MNTGPLVFIRGGTKVQRDVVTDCIGFCADQLLHKHMRDKLVMDVRLIRDLRDKEETKGDVVPDDSECEDDRPIEFEMRLDASMNMMGLIRAVCHEMVHVKQYAFGELKDTQVEAYFRAIADAVHSLYGSLSMAQATTDAPKGQRP